MTMTDMRDLQTAIASEMILNAPAEKRLTLCKAIRRNIEFTSSSHMRTTVETYKEGWYLVLEGCRSRFALWVSDNDGEFVYRRKPRDPHPLWVIELEWFDLFDRIHDRLDADLPMF